MKNLVVLLTVSVLVILLTMALFPFSLESARDSTERVRSSAPRAGNPQTGETTAHYQVYLHGLPKTFSDESFFYQSEDAYLTDDSPQTIFLKKTDVTWLDFFETLPVSLSSTCFVAENNQDFCTIGDVKLLIYLNGEAANTMLSRPIQAGDRLLITYGDLTDVEISYQLSQLNQLQ